MTLIFKLCGRDEWRAAEAAGVYAGSADDLRDGFIHFSSAAQLPGTLAKYFAGRDDLVLVAVDADRLGGGLKWEASRGGALFPHFYGAFPVASALWAHELPLGDGGQPILPAEARP
ncbi:MULTISPECIES: DUF952 domain-containing protein [Rhodomicrobium]|uniref:DUF952 domain-containing protein n=1 Tax=Rhodomicrobium TaxID=1068 RepID=UPI000B4B87EB|nr:MULTISPECIES: DUF952 domain-containing protein [Rhodomicrobium]